LDGKSLGYFGSYSQDDIFNWSDKTKELFGILPYTLISIADISIGINSDNKEKIFEIFQKLHGRKEYSRMGIRLANVK
jgi:hypothetical protein